MVHDEPSHLRALRPYLSVTIVLSVQLNNRYCDGPYIEGMRLSLPQSSS